MIQTDCVAGLPFTLVSPVVLFVLAVDLTWFVAGAGGDNPSAADLTIASLCLGLLLGLLVSTRAARRLGSLRRGLATRLLGIRVAAPPPVRRRPDDRARPGPGPRDGAGWRVVAYLLVRLPVGLAELYALFFWIGGMVNLSYPLWLGRPRRGPAPGCRPPARRSR